MTISRVRAFPTYRIIPTRVPFIDLFERIADPADWGALFKIEALTNERLREAGYALSLIPVGNRYVGTHPSYIMGAFVHLTSLGSRFSDGTYGVYYAGLDKETAIAETKYHKVRFMSFTKEPPMDVDMKVILADLDCGLEDIRNERNTKPELYDPDPQRYGPAQQFAMGLRNNGSNGIVYESVRRAGGECCAIFIPRLLQNCRPAENLIYRWDGREIVSVYEERQV